MDSTLEITFHNLDRSESLVEAIQRKYRQLHRFYSRIISASVTVSMPHKHHLHGNVYRVAIDVHVPGKRLVIDHNSDKHARHYAPSPAIADAFKAMARQLEDYARKQRHHAEREVA